MSSSILDADFTGAESQTTPAFHLHLADYVSFTNIGLIVGAYLALGAVYNIYLHPLRKIPGPLMAKLGQSWRNHKYLRGTWHDDIVDVHAKYGNVVRIAPDEVSFVDRQGLKSLYGHGKQVLKVSLGLNTRSICSFRPPDN